jgi:hypothetical protein
VDDEFLRKEKLNGEWNVMREGLSKSGVAAQLKSVILSVAKNLRMPVIPTA